MKKDYYYEEDYPDCIGDQSLYEKQYGCLTCIYKGDCIKEIRKENKNDD